MSKLFESPADEIARVIFVRHDAPNKNIDRRARARAIIPIWTRPDCGRRSWPPNALGIFPSAASTPAPSCAHGDTPESSQMNWNYQWWNTRYLTEYDFGIISG